MEIAGTIGTLVDLVPDNEVEHNITQVGGYLSLVLVWKA